jgi:hypothetical protein
MGGLISSSSRVTLDGLLVAVGVGVEAEQVVAGPVDREDAAEDAAGVEHGPVGGRGAVEHAVVRQRLARQLQLRRRVGYVILIRDQADAEGALALAGVALVGHPLPQLGEAAGALPGDVGLALLRLALLAGELDGLLDLREFLLLEAEQFLLVGGGALLGVRGRQGQERREQAEQQSEN